MKPPRMLCALAAVPSGFTLLEIIVGILLMSLVMGVVAAELRQSAQLEDSGHSIVAAGRALFDEAAVKHMTLRLAYDLDENGWWIEAYEGTFQLAGEARDISDVEREEEEKERVKEDLKQRYGSEPPPEAMPAQEFAPVSLGFIEPQALPPGIVFFEIDTPQLKEPIKKGKGYTHYLPGGFAEPTIVILHDERDDEYLTLAVQPLTGHTSIYFGKKSREDIEEEEEL